MQCPMWWPRAATRRTWCTVKAVQNLFRSHRPRNLGARTATSVQNCLRFSTSTASWSNMLGRYQNAVVDPEHREALLCGPVTYQTPPGANGYPVVLERLTNPHPARPAPADGDVVASTDYELFGSLSFALTASTWRRIGGFHERYRGYGAEDTDFADGTRRRRSDAMGRRRACFSSVPSCVGSAGRTSARHSAERQGLPGTVGLVADVELAERI